MKKVQVGLGLVALVGSSMLLAEVCSVDSARILQESAEGRSVMVLNEKDKKAVMDLEYAESKKIEKLRDSLENSMRAGSLSEESMQEKYEEFGLAQRKAKQAVENAREDAGRNQQKRVMAFRKKIYEAAGEYFSQKREVTQVLDSNTPGTIYVAAASDKTDELIKELNARYEKEKVTAMLTKSTSTKGKSQA